MNDKMEKVVHELRKRFKGSIEFYDVPFIEKYKIEYCLSGLYMVRYLPYAFIRDTDTKEIILSLNILIATDIHNHFYK